jgi:hypothetical protein
MITSRLQRLFSQASWRRWLELIQEFEEAVSISELDLLERRVRHLETQVSELRAEPRKP